MERETNSVTPAGLKQLLRSGYRLVFEKFGPQATGKTTQANKVADRLRAEGETVIVLDDLEEGGMGGVRVYAK